MTLRRICVYQAITLLQRRDSHRDPTGRTDRHGGQVAAPASDPGESTSVRGGDALDVLSERHYDDATRFWHLGDANTELEAQELVRVPGRTIDIPES